MHLTTNLNILSITHPPVSAVIHFTKQKLKGLNTRSYRTKIIYQYTQCIESLILVYGPDLIAPLNYSDECNHDVC